MKNRGKIMGIIIGSLVAAGLVFMFIGVMFGAKRGMFFDKNGIHVSGEEGRTQEPISQMAIESLKQIDIDVISSEVEFIESDQYGFEIVNQQQTEFVWSAEGGELKIKEKVKDGFFGFFNINLDFFDWDSNFPDVKVYLPKDALLKEVSVHIVNGSALLQDMTTKELNVKNTSGDVNVVNVKADQMSLKRTSGELEMKNCQIGALDLTVVSGSSRIYDLKSNEFNLKSTSGSCELTGEIAEEIKIKSISGSVKLGLMGNSDDYNKKVDSISGDLYINGKEIESDTDLDSKDTNKVIDVATTSGSVIIDFKEKP